MVDGFFVSNFVGKTPFAAVNFIMPVLMILGSVGFMFGAGGSALVSKTMGEGDDEKAQRLFSLFVYCTAICGIVIAVISFIFLRPLASLMGAEGAMLDNGVTYGRILLVALPCYMLQFEMCIRDSARAASFAGKPCTAVPLKEEEEFRPNLSALLPYIKNGTLCLLCNPNNPTGQLLLGSELRPFLDELQRKGAYLMVDECFIEFSRQSLAQSMVCLLYTSFAMPNIDGGLVGGASLKADFAKIVNY